MIQYAIVAIVMAVSFLVLRRFVLTLFASSLALIILFPRALTGSSQVVYSGWGSYEPRLSNFAIPLILGLLVTVRGLPTALRVVIALLALYLVFGTALVWEHEPPLWSGLLQLTVFVLAIRLGALAGKSLQASPDPRLTRIIVVAIFVICLVQLGAGALQIATGTRIVPISEESVEAVASRVNGTTPHPNTLGKYMFLLLMLVLPQTRLADRSTRIVANAAVAVALVVAFLTGGRAAIIACVAMVAIWSVLAGDRQNRKNPLLLLGVVAIATPFVGAVIDRFQEDPEGGSRSRLLDAYRVYALDHVGSGFGPNLYEFFLSKVDVTTAATGLPVHNVVLLTAAELGIVGAVLVLSLMLWPFVLAFRAQSRASSLDYTTRLWSTVVVASVPGFAVLCLTGWAMISPGPLALWMLVLSFCAASIATPTMPATSETDPQVQVSQKRPRAIR